MSKPDYGFIEWKPTKSVNPHTGQTTIESFDQLLECLEFYRDEWPLTIRGWLYRMGAMYGWSKDTEDHLEYLFAKGRRSKRIPWEAVTSSRGDLIAYAHSDPDDWLPGSVFDVDYKNIDLQAGQARRVILWVETAGYVPRFRELAKHYGCDLRAGQGFDTLTAKYEFAKLVADGDACMVLHFGDLDGSGQTVSRSLDLDVRAFVTKMTGNPAHFEHERIGVLDSHIDIFSLAADPYTEALRKKDKKSGHTFDGKRVCQAEALLPSQAVDIAREALERHLDVTLIEARRAAMMRARRDTKAMLLKGWIEEGSPAWDVYMGDA